ncbi:MAG: Ig-like domain-containing protein [Terriglobales bacterium]
MKQFSITHAISVLALLVGALSLTGCGTGTGLQSVTVTPANPTLAKGDTVRLQATATYNDGLVETVTTPVIWKSEKPEIAAVDDEGQVTGMGEGAAKITATYQAVVGSTYVTIGAPVLVEISVSASHASLPLGESEQMIATGKFSDGSTKDVTHSATWTSSGTGIARVGPSGLVVGSAPGTVTISATVTAKSGPVTGSMPLSVGQAALLGITVSPAQSSLPIGETAQLAATGSFSDGSTQPLTQVTWSSSSSTIVSVSSSGAVQANALGTATISAASGQVVGTASVTAAPPVVVSLDVAPLALSLVLESSSQLHAVATWSDGTTQDVTPAASWSSTPAGIVTISASGRATAWQVGSTTVFATYSGVTGTSNLAVTPLLYVNYFDRIDAQTANIDGTVYLTNPGVTAGSSAAGKLCAMIYVFDQNQEMNECCGCSVSDSGFRALSLLHDLTSDPLTGIPPAAGAILMVPSNIQQNPQCSASSLSPNGVILGWETNVQGVPSGSPQITETSFSSASLSSATAANLAAMCGFIQSQGGGQGICTCGKGGK